MVGFTISLESVWIYKNCLFFVTSKVLSFHTLQTIYLPLSLSYQSSKQTKKTQVTKRDLWMKSSTCREGAIKNQPTRWEWHHNTFTPSLHLVSFCRLCTPQNSLHAEWPITHQGTQYCSLHSFLDIRQPICAMFSSNKSSQHNMPYRLSTAHSVATTTTTHTTWPCSTTHPTAFHNPPVYTDNKHKA